MAVRDRVLGTTAGYRALLRVVSADRFMKTIVADHIRPEPGTALLDIGCGEGALSAFVGDVEYLGIDHNPSYIAKAQQRYGAAGPRFVCADLAELAATTDRRFARVTAIGVLHHLDDELARSVLSTAAGFLTEDGKLVRVDPVFHPDQRLVTRLLMAADRGKFVRHPAHYRLIAEGLFGDVATTVRTGLLSFPYTHFVMEMTLPTGSTRTGAAAL